MFRAERTHLATVSAGTEAVIEHVGSTAVPGLGAKPIVDIMVGVDTLSQAEARIEQLRANGYQYVPEYEALLPERRYFRKYVGGRKTHHLHCVVRSSGLWVEHLAFRDYLRATPSAAGAYNDLKRRLADKHGADHRAYSEAKTSFIADALSRARPLRRSE